MKKSLIILSLVAAMGLMLTSQVNAQSSQVRFPVSTTFYGCEELVDVEAELHLVYNSVTSKSGNWMYKFHINMKGTGVGQTSGAVYQLNYVLNESVNGSKAFNVTYTLSILLIGQGDVPDQKANGTFHITVNANGELTAEVNNFSLECN